MTSAAAVVAVADAVVVVVTVVTVVDQQPERTVDGRAWLSVPGSRQ